LIFQADSGLLATWTNIDHAQRSMIGLSVQETDIGRPARYVEPLIMTYNFDPNKWYEIERAALDRQFKSGELSGPAYEAALDELERRYNTMIDRLDGTYQLPK
jgi:hypothetical protein